MSAPRQTGSFMVGNEQRQTYGHSLIADPWGHVVAKASDGVGLVSTRIDPVVIAKARATDPDRRPSGEDRARLMRRKMWRRAR